MKIFKGKGNHSVNELEAMVLERDEQLYQLNLPNTGSEDPRLKDLRWALEKIIMTCSSYSNVHQDAVRKYKAHFGEPGVFLGSFVRDHVGWLTLKK